MKRVLCLIMVVISTFAFVGCEGQATKVSRNLSLEADNFNVVRQLTVISLFTNDTLFQMTGKISITPKIDRLEIIAEKENGVYVKHFVHLGDNLTYIVEDLGLGANQVSKYQYTLNFNPKMWIPVNVKYVD